MCFVFRNSLFLLVFWLLRSISAVVGDTSADLFAREYILPPSDPSSGEMFGFSVAVSDDGNFTAVSSPHDSIGTILIYSRNWDELIPWTQQPKVYLDESSFGDQFGYSLDLSSDAEFLIAGAIGVDTGGMYSVGRAYILKRETASGDSWTKVATFGPESDAGSINFGFSVAMSSDGTTAIVGCPGEGIDAGDVYVYSQNATGHFVFRHKLAYPIGLTPSDKGRFGASIDISEDGSMIVVGARKVDGRNGVDTGMAYIYTLSNGTWAHTVSFGNSSYLPEQYDEFGYDVAISGDGSFVIITGLNSDDEANGLGNTGIAFVYVHSNGTWHEEARLTGNASSDWEIGVEFGFSVAISSDGHYAIVGSRRSDVWGGQYSVSDSGAAYVFTRTLNGTGNGYDWDIENSLYLHPSSFDTYDHIGRTVAIGNKAVIIGAPDKDHVGSNSGLAYSWTPLPPTTTTTTSSSTSTSTSTSTTTSTTTTSTTTTTTSTSTVPILQTTEISATTSSMCERGQPNCQCIDHSTCFNSVCNLDNDTCDPDGHSPASLLSFFFSFHMVAILSI